MTKCVRNFAFLMTIAMVVSLPAWAQATASLTGTVADPTGAVIPGAEVTVTHLGTGATRTATTDASGKYLVAQLAPATYKIVVKMSGFKTAVHDQVPVQVGITTTLDIQLAVGAVTETVTVEGGAGGLNTSDASLGIVIAFDEIGSLPSLDLNPVGLLSLQPGVTYVPGQTDGIGGYGGANDLDGRSGSVNGARSDQSSVTLDGVDVNDPIKGYAFTSVLRVTQAALQEFRTTTTNYGAEGGGRSSAAQVALVTKSGTNEIHGQVYYAHRNEAINANDFFLNRAGVDEPKFRRHLYGAAAGGPVVKDRFFLFGNWERMEESLFASAERDIPALHMRDGVFIYECQDLAGFAPCPTTQTTVQGISGTSFTIPAGSYGLSPAEITAIDPLGIGPDPAVLAEWASYPTPNSTGSNDGINLLGFRFGAPVTNEFNYYLLRADVNIDRAAKHIVFWRGILQDDTISGVPQFPGLPPNQKNLINNKGFALGYTALLSPSVVNNFRWGLTRIKEEGAGVRNSEYVRSRFIDDLQGFRNNTDGTTTSEGRTIPQQHIRNDTSWTRGGHTFSFGGEARFTRNRNFTNINSFHGFTVNPSWLPNGGKEIVAGESDCVVAGCTAVPGNASGSAFKDFLTQMLGPITQVDALFNFDKTGATAPSGEPVRRKFAVDEYELYFQDQWRATPTLTLNFGLRYVTASPPWEQDGNQVVPTPRISEWFDCRQTAMLAGQPSLGTCGSVSLDLGGKANNAPGYYNWDKNNFSPRIGIAWAPRSLGWFSGNGKMTIRVGYSLVYDRLGNALAVSFDQIGSFGMSTEISSPLGGCAIGSNFGAPSCVRFSGFFDTAAATAQSLQASPGGGFPSVPPTGLTLVSNTVDDSIRTPYSHTANLSIARELPGGITVEVAYVGRRGIKLPIIRDFAMPLDLVDPASGMSAFGAAQQIAALAAGGQDILTLGTSLAYWENLFPGFGPTGVNQGCLFFDEFGVDPGIDTDGDGSPDLFNCGFTASQVAFDFMLGWHGSATPGDVAGARPGFGDATAWELIDLDGLPSFMNCPTGTDLDGDGFLDCPFAFFSGQWVALNGWTGLARSEYHAFQLSVRKRMSQGLLFNLNYTLSHSLDHSSVPERTDTGGGYELGSGVTGFLINSWRPDLDYANSDFDMRHQFNTHWVYELPIGRGRTFGSGLPGWASQIIGGWEISGIFRANSGLPLNISASRTWPTNWNISTNATCAPVGSHPLGQAFGPCPATQNVSSAIHGGDPSSSAPNVFADPDTAINSFRYNAAGERGTRNVLRGDNYVNMDFGIGKSFNMPWEGHQFQFRWDMFNATNSAYFDTAYFNGRIGDAGTFGDYFQTLGGPRRMQGSLRYQF